MIRTDIGQASVYWHLRSHTLQTHRQCVFVHSVPFTLYIGRLTGAQAAHMETDLSAKHNRYVLPAQAGLSRLCINFTQLP